MSRSNNSKRHVAILLLVAAGMFGFAFALVPLYEIFCEITGINGRTSGEAASVVQIAEISDREVTIQFAAQVNRGMPWEFRPTESQMRVRLGEVNTTEYYARNRASGTVTGQAVPSVAPGAAAPYLHKVECFCFTQQHLDGDADIDMPVQFYVDPDLPEDIGTLSLSYTMFRVPDAEVVVSEPVSGTPADHEGHLQP